MPRETNETRRAREHKRLLTDAAAALRARTGREIAARHLDNSESVPPHSRYRMAALLEALAHEVAQRRLSEWAVGEAVALARAILDEEEQPG